MDDCDVGPDGFCYTCQMHEDEHMREFWRRHDEDKSEREWSDRCIGGRCCNPTFDHTSVECYTPEDAEAWMSEEDDDGNAT